MSASANGLATEFSATRDVGKANAAMNGNDPLCVGGYTSSGDWTVAAAVSSNKGRFDRGKPKNCSYTINVLYNRMGE